MDKQLFVAALYCRKFATFERVMRPVAIVAVSHDEAMGMAIAQAKRLWTGERYSEHNAEVRPVPQDLIEQVCKR